MNVEDHHVRELSTDEVQHLSPIGSLPHRKAMLRQRRGDQLTDHGVVIHDEYTTAGSPHY